LFTIATTFPPGCGVLSASAVLHQHRVRSTMTERSLVVSGGRA